MATTHYSLPEFDGDTPPDLVGVVNAAFATIDTALYNLQQAVDQLESKGVNTTPTSNLTVDDLKALGITADGIVVNKTVS